MAASAGGLAALSTVLEGLPASLAVPVVVVQHVHPDHRSRLAEILARRTELPVREAVHGAPLTPGVVVAVPGHHLLIRESGRLELSEAPTVNFVRPAADVTFASAADVYGAGTVAVVLSGTGSDGAEGVRAVHEAGGEVIVQEVESAEHAGMPRAAVATGVVDRVVPIGDIAAVLLELVAAHDRGRSRSRGES